jgi:hypothetical protein
LIFVVAGVGLLGFAAAIFGEGMPWDLGGVLGWGCLFIVGGLARHSR